MQFETSGKIFLTDGLWRKTLATLKALYKAGIKVSVGERTPLAPALFSKFASERSIYPSVTLTPQAFIDWLERKLTKTNYDVLLTPEEETSLLVAKNRNRLSSLAGIPIPDYEKLIFAGDKFKVAEFAQNVGVKVPNTHPVSNISDLNNAVKNIGFPAVIKPRKGTGARGLRYINSEQDLRGVPAEIFTKHGDFLMQEYVPGSEYYGVSAIFNNKNKMRAAFCHKKLRQYPTTGGVSTYAESVHRDDLVQITEKLLSSVGWFGIANVEFKISDKDGSPYVMEINPRLWGSVHLAVESGVNFPVMLYDLGLTGDTKETFSYEDGVRYRWMLQGDLLSFTSKLVREKKIDSGFFNFFEKDIKYGIISLEDPMPAVGKVLSVIDYFTSKEMRRFHA